MLEAENKALVFAFEATNSAELAPEPVFERMMDSATLHDSEWTRQIPEGYVRYEHFMMKVLPCTAACARALLSHV